MWSLSPSPCPPSYPPLCPSFALREVSRVRPAGAEKGQPQHRLPGSTPGGLSVGGPAGVPSVVSDTERTAIIGLEPVLCFLGILMCWKRDTTMCPSCGSPS